MQLHHVNLFVAGAMFGSSIPETGIGAIGIIFAVLNLAVYARGIQKLWLYR